MATPWLLTMSGPSLTAQRAETTSEAVWIQRRKGETKTRWIGKPRLVLSFRPVRKALNRPASTRGGSHGLVAVVIHNGSKLSIRSPCLMTTTFCWCLASLFSGEVGSIVVFEDVSSECEGLRGNELYRQRKERTCFFSVFRGRTCSVGTLPCCHFFIPLSIKFLSLSVYMLKNK